jgi:hypothetical protein
MFSFGSFDSTKESKLGKSILMAFESCEILDVARRNLCKEYDLVLV